MSMLKPALFWIGMVALGCSAVSVAQEPVEGEGREIFTQRCSVCHELTTVTTQHHSNAEWREIIQRMVLNGSQATDAEREAITLYLAMNYGSEMPSSAPVPPASAKSTH